MPTTVITLNTFFEEFLNQYTQGNGRGLLNKLKEINPNFDLDTLYKTNSTYSDLQAYLSQPSEEYKEKLLDKLREINSDVDILLNSLSNRPFTYTALEELLAQPLIEDGPSLQNKLKENYPDFDLNALSMTIYAYELELASLQYFDIQKETKRISDAKIKELSANIKEKISKDFITKKSSKKNLKKSDSKWLIKEDEKLKRMIETAIKSEIESLNIEEKSISEALAIRNKKMNEIVSKLLDDLKPIFKAAILLVFETKQPQIMAKFKALILKADLEENIAIRNSSKSDIHLAQALALLRSNIALNKRVEIFQGHSLEVKEYFETYLIRVLFTSRAIEELIDESLLNILKCFVLPYPELMGILKNNVHIYATTLDHIIPPLELGQVLESVRVNNELMQSLLTKFKEYSADDKELKLILNTWLQAEKKSEEVRKVDLPSWIKCRKPGKPSQTTLNGATLFRPSPSLPRSEGSVNELEWKACKKPTNEQKEQTDPKVNLDRQLNRSYLTKSSPASTKPSLEISKVRIPAINTPTYP